MILIVCTTEELSGMFAQVHREMDMWFEEDVVIYGTYAICVYPKLYWQAAAEMELAA